MSLTEMEFAVSSPSPIDIVEAMFRANEWPFERTEYDEIFVEMAGGWCDYEMFFAWREDLQSLYFACKFDMKIPESKRKGINDLLVMMNQKIWMGHFDLSQEDGSPMYRNTIPVRGLSQVSVEILEDMMDVALVECERFYPAFQFLVWGGHAPEKAISAALLDCAGEA
ncbi:type III secretion system chaperone family protein [Curvivirga aplysinae]|uniref:YbjN domain-containing protein n=1 Tax=Curvivirga aplysinae TaxID=2529852 RepID=UPI0012BD01E4|nr:YbjN domain-containing protein [Curvivirga aplysinae]MTI08970.1 hypothetical protein [Curvivirga aplysinae]